MRTAATLPRPDADKQARVLRRLERFEANEELMWQFLHDPVALSVHLAELLRAKEIDEKAKEPS